MLWFYFVLLVPMNINIIYYFSHNVFHDSYFAYIITIAYSLEFAIAENALQRVGIYDNYTNKSCDYFETVSSALVKPI